MDAVTIVRQLAYVTEIVQLLILAMVYIDAAALTTETFARRLRWSKAAFFLAMAFSLGWQFYGAYVNAATVHDGWALLMTLAVLALNTATANLIVRFLDFRKGHDE